MSDQVGVGAVLYAKDVARVSAFYETLMGLEVRDVEADHVVLESRLFQLVIVAMPEPLAASIHIDTPPSRRTDTPIKLSFVVADIASARSVAETLGGALNPAEQEWEFQDCIICDGHDPEGNVVQFRQRMH